MDNDLSGCKPDAREYYEATLSSLYEEYYDKIARYAYVRIGDRAEAEDIASDVFKAQDIFHR
jgi:DNA-directed RNA polymerase specialized sigma24 family protein